MGKKLIYDTKLVKGVIIFCDILSFTIKQIFQNVDVQLRNTKGYICVTYGLQVMRSKLNFFNLFFLKNVVKWSNAVQLDS